MKKDLWSWKSFSILKDFCSFVQWDTASFRRIKTELWNKNLHSLCSFTKFSVLWNLENKEISLNTGSSTKFSGVRKKNLKNSYCFLEFAFRWFLLFTNQITVYVYLKLFHLILKSNPLNKWLLLRLNFCKNRIQCIYLDRILSNNVFQKTSFFACNHLYSKITMMLKNTPRCVFSIMFSHCYAK